MSETPNVKKLKRSYLQHYIDSTFGDENAVWFKIGKYSDDLGMELNPNTETIKNIWDETYVTDNGYEPDMSVETYYLDTDDSIYLKIKDIIMNRKVGNDCKTKLLEVLIDKTEGPFDAWIEDCIVKPQSYGGSQGGVNVPFTITPCGNRVEGTVTITNKVPTFTPKESS